MSVDHERMIRWNHFYGTFPELRPVTRLEVRTRVERPSVETRLIVETHLKVETRSKRKM